MGLQINGRPFVVREADKPFQNLEYTGIDRSRVEDMEARLKSDVLREVCSHQISMHSTAGMGPYTWHGPYLLIGLFQFAVLKLVLATSERLLWHSRYLDTSRLRRQQSAILLSAAMVCLPT